jgi:hypothetical protein
MGKKEFILGAAGVAAATAIALLIARNKLKQK